MTSFLFLREYNSVPHHNYQGVFSAVQMNPLNTQKKGTETVTVQFNIFDISAVQVNLHNYWSLGCSPDFYFPDV